MQKINLFVGCPDIVVVLNVVGQNWLNELQVMNDVEFVYKMCSKDVLCSAW